MSSRIHNNVALPALQEEDLNDVTWNEMVSTRLPKNWQEKARELKAWQRQRGVRTIADLLRALLVSACCQYSMREISACGRCSKVSDRGSRASVAQTHRAVTGLDRLVAQ